MTTRFLLALCTSAVLAGCAVHGTYLEPEEVQDLRSSVTTADDLIEMLGSPSVTVPMSDGKTMWIYEGIFRAASADSYIPVVGLITGRTNKQCSTLKVLVDNETGELGKLDFSTTKDSDHWTMIDSRCR